MADQSPDTGYTFRWRMPREGDDREDELDAEPDEERLLEREDEMRRDEERER